MSEFMSLRDFLLLRDPIDREPKRSIHRSSPLRNCNAVDAGTDMVERYDLACALWNEFGAEGPPAGTTVIMLQPGHGGGVGAIRKLIGVCPHDQRFFHIGGRGFDDLSLVTRETWFCEMCPIDHPALPKDRHGRFR